MIAIKDAHCLFKSGLGVEAKYCLIMVQVNTFKANGMVDVVVVEVFDLHTIKDESCKHDVSSFGFVALLCIYYSIDSKGNQQYIVNDV